MKTIKSWSFSRLMVFEECKYRAKLQWLDKIPDLQPHTAADRGTAIHQEAEDYVTGKAALTHNLRFFHDDLSSLASHYAAGRVVCEEEWAFDSDWQVTDWKAGWLRLKCDAVCHLSKTHLVVIDYKTGQRYKNEIKHERQLILYAVAALFRYPEVSVVTTELWYLDKNDVAKCQVKRSQLKRYLSTFDKSGIDFTTETEFKPNPNTESCKWCPYGPAKQADCIYGLNVDKIKADGKASALTASNAVFVKQPSATDHLFE